MNSKLTKTTLALALCFPVVVLQAQTDSGSNYLLYSLAGIALLAFIFITINVADNLLVIEAKQTGADRTGANLGLFPAIREIFRPKAPLYTEGTPTTVLTKGHNILLQGEANGPVDDSVQVARYAIKPTDFLGLQPIPKMLVEVGDTVKAGDPLFFDKKMPEVKFVAPVSGEVLEVKRGEKRAIVEIIILADREITHRSLSAPALDADRAELVSFLQESGGWILFKERPFNVVADPNEVPRDIFVSTFDTGPLAPDNTVLVAGSEAAFQQGINVLNRLTSGSVYLGLDGNGDNPPTAFSQVQNAQLHYFKGEHPAGNVGVQIHHIAPIDGTRKVWTLGVQEVITLGNLWLENRFNAERIIALTGAELSTPKYVKTFIGANTADLLKNNLTNDRARIISGDVLSGTQIQSDGFVGFYDDQVTVIKEGDEYELFGWLVPLSPRPTISGTFPNAIFGEDYRFEADTNTHGERRAFVVTNDYERVMPMDIFTQQLMKSIMVNDFESMEGLGILELVEEDVALCEFVCVSKQPLQRILRKGLETMREQG